MAIAAVLCICLVLITMVIRQGDILPAAMKALVVISHGIHILVQTVAVYCDEMGFDIYFVLDVYFLL